MKVDELGAFRIAHHDDVDVPVILGWDETGALVDLPIVERNLLVGGTPGGGKSSILGVIVCDLARRLYTALVGIDMKRTELASVKDRFSCLVTAEASAAVLLRQLVEEMDSRYDELEACNERRMAQRLLPLERVIVGDPDNLRHRKLVRDGLVVVKPRIVLVADELADLFATTGPLGASIERDYLKLGQMARAAQINLISCTQRPSYDLMPTSIRAVHHMRICFWADGRDDVEMILGDDMAKHAPAHLIPKDNDHAGVCYCRTGTALPRKARCLFLTAGGRAQSVWHLNDHHPELTIDLGPQFDIPKHLETEEDLEVWRKSKTESNTKEPVQ